MDMYAAVGQSLPENGVRQYADELGYQEAQAGGCQLSAQEYIDTFLAHMTANRKYSAEVYRAQAAGAGRIELDSIHTRWESVVLSLEFALAA